MSSCLWRVILVEAVPDHGYEQIILLVVFACTSLLYLAFSSHLFCMFVLLLRRLPHMTRVELCGLIYIYTHTKQPLPKFFFTFNAFTCVFLALCGFHKGALTVRDIKCIGHWHFPWLAHTHTNANTQQAQFKLTTPKWRQTKHSTRTWREKKPLISRIYLSPVFYGTHIIIHLIEYVQFICMIYTYITLEHSQMFLVYTKSARFKPLLFTPPQYNLCSMRNWWVLELFAHNAPSLNHFGINKMPHHRMCVCVCLRLWVCVWVGRSGRGWVGAGGHVIRRQNIRNKLYMHMLCIVSMSFPLYVRCVLYGSIECRKYCTYVLGIYMVYAVHVESPVKQFVVFKHVRHLSTIFFNELCSKDPYGEWCDAPNASRYTNMCIWTITKKW